MNTFTSIEDLFSFIRTQFVLFRWTDAVDILLLAVLLYYTYRFISERRAGKLALGILIMGIVMAISDLVNLHALQFLLGNIFQVGILALIILFQPELRGALEKMGEEPLRGFKGLGEQNAEELAESTMEPGNRILKQIAMDDAQAAAMTFTSLMGESSTSRKKFIEENAFRANLDI